MAPAPVGEQFSSSAVTQAIPPHLRKKAVNSPAQSSTSAPDAVCLAVEMAPSTESKHTPLPSSYPSPAGHSGSPKVDTAAVGGMGSSQDAPEWKDRFNGLFGGKSSSLEASCHAPPPAESQAPVMPSSATSRSAGRTVSEGSSDAGVGLSPLRRYQPGDLIDIAKQCSGRLPPASAIQAMFLYEMQRETESERLFEGQMFRLAKQEDELVAQARQHAAMEARIAALEKQVAKNDYQVRLATNDLRMTVQQQKLADQEARLQKAEESLANVPERLQTLKQTHDKFAADTEAAFKDVVHQASSAAKIVLAGTRCQVSTSDVNIMKEELDVLFNDRDGILSQLAEVNGRMQQLADNIHQLTIQKTTAQTLSPVPVQRIPIVGLNGDLVDVAVPKGKPAVGFNGSRRPDVKTFVPGKPWGA